MPPHNNMMFKFEAAEDILSQFSSTFKTFIASLWSTLSWDDIAQLYCTALGIYIGLNEGIITNAPLYSGIIGGALGFFSHPFLKAFAQAPVKAFHNGRINAKYKKLTKEEQALIETARQFHEDYSQFNPFLCTQIYRIINLKLNTIQFELNCTAEIDPVLDTVIPRVEALHHILKNYIQQLEDLEDPQTEVDILLRRMHKYITNLSSASLDKLTNAPLQAPQFFCN